MKNLAEKLEEIGVECILPKHFKNLEDTNSMIQLKQDISEEDFKRIAERENWF